MRSGPRKAFKVLATVFALSAFSLWGFFAGVRAIFGKEIGGGYYGPAVTLCVLDRDGSSGFIVGGDSRAKMQIDPKVIEDRTGIKAVNAAESYLQGGDITTLVNSLRANPAALETHPILIISIFAQIMNDINLENLPMPGIWNWSAGDHLRLAARIPGRYLAWFGGRYLPALRREARHMRRKDGFTCTDEVGLPAPQVATRGYRPNLIPTEAHLVEGPGGWMIDNGSRRAFLDALAWLEKSPARAVIILDGPNEAAWAEEALGPDWPAWQARFGREVAAAVAGRPKLRFLDLSSPETVGLVRADFHDMYHLNPGGAEKLSGWLADWLNREFKSVAAR